MEGVACCAREETSGSLQAVVPKLRAHIRGPDTPAKGWLLHRPWSHDTQLATTAANPLNGGMRIGFVERVFSFGAPSGDPNHK